MRRLILCGMLLSGPAVAEQLSPELLAHYHRTHFDRLKTYCPNARTTIDLNTCTQKLGTETLQFVSCGYAFIVRDHRHACYEMIRNRWIKKHSN